MGAFVYMLQSYGYFFTFDSFFSPDDGGLSFDLILYAHGILYIVVNVWNRIENFWRRYHVHFDIEYFETFYLT